MPPPVQAPWSALERAVEAPESTPTTPRSTMCGSGPSAAVRGRGGRARPGQAGRWFARAAADLQQVLGELNDAVVAEGWLRPGWAFGRRSPGAVFAAGSSRDRAWHRRRGAGSGSACGRRSSQPGRALRESDLVRAAGGLVLRQGVRGIEVLLVHRPAYEDWSLPKGKFEPGEPEREAALREVAEERCLALPVRARGRHDGVRRFARPTEQVRYWAMVAPGQEPVAANEVDDVCWASPAEAAKRLDYAHDRNLLDGLGDAMGSRRSSSSSGTPRPATARSGRSRTSCDR